jgi:hypothetical protein
MCHSSRRDGQIGRLPGPAAVEVHTDLSEALAPLLEVAQHDCVFGSPREHETRIDAPQAHEQISS